MQGSPRKWGKKERGERRDKQRGKGGGKHLLFHLFFMLEEPWIVLCLHSDAFTDF